MLLTVFVLRHAAGLMVTFGSKSEVPTDINIFACLLNIF